MRRKDEEEKRKQEVELLALRATLYHFDPVILRLDRKTRGSSCLRGSERSWEWLARDPCVGRGLENTRFLLLSEELVLESSKTCR